MPYVKTIWETGDLATAEAMNNMEDGIGDAVETAETALSRIANAQFVINEDMDLVVTI